MYMWITFLYTWNFHNIVNQLYSNMGSFPGGSEGKESACNAGDLCFGREDPMEKEMATHSSTLA